MNTTQHTPTPWANDWTSNGKGRDEIYCCIESDDVPTGQPHKIWESIIISGAKRNANAAHIVACVNAHDELVAALRACDYELLTLRPRLTPQYHKSVDACREMARAALAKVSA